MSCELNKVISIINEVANGTKNPVALKELNELKSDLTQFSVSMQSINEVKDVSKLLDTLTRVSKSTGNINTKDTPVLNSLPNYVVGQRNMTYAGVGSRETPPEILAEMTKIAQELATKKYSLQSGGAIGADMAFEGKSYPKVLKAGNADVVNKSGKVVLKANTEVKIGTKEYTDAYYVFTDRTNNGRVTGLDFTKAESIKGTKSYSAFDVKDRDVDKKAMAIAKELHPKFENLKSDFAKKLMARNNFQVFGSNLDKPVDFVLFYAKESKNPLRPEGGTGQAVEAARRKGIPTINMSEEGWRDRLNDVLDGKVQDTTSNKTSVQLTGRSNVIDISSGTKGLPGALTNHTVLSKKKGSIENDYPIEFNGTKYDSVESAYQDNKVNESKTKPAKEDSENYKLMVELISEKFSSYPQLLDALTKAGGLKYLENAVHQPTTKNTVWETGGQDWFISALKEAYTNVSSESAKIPNKNGSIESTKPKLGSVVKYNNNYYVVKEVNEKANNVQLINKDGKNLPGTPGIDKVQFVKQLPVTEFNGVEYAYDTKNDRLYTENGEVWKLKSDPTRAKIISSIKETTSAVGKEFDRKGVDGNAHINLEPPKIEKVKEDEIPIEKVEGLTSGQSKAFKEILEILDSDNEHAYLLEGPGGTGKSFVVGEILKEHLKGAGTRGEKVKVMATATAHAAKNIIGDFVEKSIKELDKADSSVIETTRAVTIQLPRTLKNMMSSKKVQPELIVVLDEVSMVSPLVISGIQGYVKTINDSGIAKVKLVMLGDRAQLRPVFTPKNPNKIELTPYTNRATGNKYVYIEGIAFDIKNSNGIVTLDGVPADVISGTMIGDKMVITNLDSLKLKSSLFRNTSSVRGTTLLENMRNPKLAEMFDKFRTGDDRVLTTVAEEEDPRFTKQYTDARNELKQFKVNGEELVIDLATSSIQNNTKLLKSWIDGKTAVVAFTNQAVNDINSNMTRIAGKLVGKEQQVASFGLFEGQTLKSTANIINSYGKGDATTKLTNNTSVTISKLFKASAKTKYDNGHILPIFDGDLLHEIARDNFIEEENSLYVYGIRLNINKMPLAEQANINMANVTFTDPEDRKVQKGSTIVTSSTESEIGKLLEEYGEFVQMTYMDGDLIEANVVPTKGIRLPNDVAPFAYNMELSKAEYGAVKPVYAMTAHKSQGTTLENVIVVEDWKPNRYLTEVAKLELMYVAVSRSAGKIVLAGEKIGRLLQQVESSEAVINTSLGTIRAIKAQGC